MKKKIKKEDKLLKSFKNIELLTKNEMNYIIGGWAPTIGTDTKDSWITDMKGNDTKGG